MISRDPVAALVGKVAEAPGQAVSDAVQWVELGCPPAGKTVSLPRGDTDAT